jgi:hypothetical protein
MYDAIDFHASDSVLNLDSNGRNPSVFRFFVARQLTFRRLLFRLEDRHTWQGKPLERAVLCQMTALRQLIPCLVGNSLVVRLPFICCAQEPHITRFIDQQYVFEGVIFAFTAVIDFLLLVIEWTRYGSFGAIVIKRGDVSRSSAASSCCSWAANCAGVRAGSRS